MSTDCTNCTSPIATKYAPAVVAYAENRSGNHDAEAVAEQVRDRLKKLESDGRLNGLSTDEVDGIVIELTKQACNGATLCS